MKSLTLSNFDVVIELRELLRDQLATSYITNFSIQDRDTGKTLNNFAELKNLITAPTDSGKAAPVKKQSQ